VVVEVVAGVGIDNVDDVDEEEDEKEEEEKDEEEDAGGFEPRFKSAMLTGGKALTEFAGRLSQ
jgi:Ran GTPase-activating protein (RanGAP) involved in mRNA processing and transport